MAFPACCLQEMQKYNNFPNTDRSSTHSFPIVRFSDFFRGQKKGALGTNGLTKQKCSTGSSPNFASNFERI